MIKDGYKTYVGANSSLFYFQKKKSSSFLHLKIEWRPTKENVMGKREKGSKCNLDKDSVPSEKLKLFHGLGVHGHYGVVVVDSLIHNKPVRRLFTFQNRGREVLLPRFPAFQNKNFSIKQTSQSKELLVYWAKYKKKKKNLDSWNEINEGAESWLTGPMIRLAETCLLKLKKKKMMMIKEQNSQRNKESSEPRRFGIFFFKVFFSI